ncbi:MAG: LytTR family transcriptional regulator [Hespellia sp.]|nr:LytTR family transcriptional regulator [Hespellia sp.]
MGKQFISDEELIRRTMENVRSFYYRDKGYTTAPMSDDFMWIGSNDFQWCEGLEEFLRVTENEYQEPSVMLSDEEYHLLFHEHNVWVVYGRYKATAALSDGSVIYAHVRGTYVWRRMDGELRLVHVHGSHAQDIPLNQIPLPQDRLTEHSPFFNYMKRMDAMNSDVDKLVFRGRDGMFRYPRSTEVLYLKAANQNCTVCTSTGDFEAVGLLAEYFKKMPAEFLRIHKSYAVNITHIASFCRYKVVLTNGQELPVSRARYMELKNRLSQTVQ